MDRHDRVQVVIEMLEQVRSCRRCGTAIRFGDYECSHCGADLEDDFREWAEKLLYRLEGSGD